MRRDHPEADVATAQLRIVRRLRRLVADARASGLVLVADADAPGIRVMSKEAHDAADDLRKVGELVDCDACGGSTGSNVAPW